MDRAAAQQSGPQAAGAFFGLAAPDDLAVRGLIDIVRIEDGRIVERWGSRPDVAHFEPLWRSSFALDTPDAPQTVALRRLSEKPGCPLPAPGRRGTMRRVRNRNT